MQGLDLFTIQNKVIALLVSPKAWKRNLDTMKHMDQLIQDQEMVIVYTIE